MRRIDKGIMKCPSCGADATIDHQVDIPRSALGNIRMRFNPGEGATTVSVIKGFCPVGHSFVGQVDDIIEPSVTEFLAEVEVWDAGYSEPHYSKEIH